MELPGSEQWETIVVDPMKLINRHDKKTPLKDWRWAGQVKFGGTLMGLILTDFKWGE